MSTSKKQTGKLYEKFDYLATKWNEDYEQRNGTSFSFDIKEVLDEAKKTFPKRGDIYYNSTHPSIIINRLLKLASDREEWFKENFGEKNKNG
jgi:hypothetical protein